MLPRDPYILLSYINTLLRDEYGSLEELCRDRELSEREIKETLLGAGFVYRAEENKFA